MSTNDRWYKPFQVFIWSRNPTLPYVFDTRGQEWQHMCKMSHYTYHCVTLRSDVLAHLALQDLQVTPDVPYLTAGIPSVDPHQVALPQN